MIRLNALAEIPQDLTAQPLLKDRQAKNKTEEVGNKVFFQKAEEASSDSEDEFYSIKIDILSSARDLNQGCLFIASVKLLSLFDRLHGSESQDQIHQKRRDLLKRENHLWIIEILANPLFAKFYVNQKSIAKYTDKAFETVLKCFNFDKKNPKGFLINFWDKVSVFKKYLQLSLKCGHDKQVLYYFFNDFFYYCLTNHDFTSARILLEILSKNFEENLNSQELLGNVDMQTLNDFFDDNTNIETLQQIMWKFVLEQIRQGVAGFAELIECFLFLKLGKFSDAQCKMAYEEILIPPYFNEDLDEEPENYFLNLQDGLISFVMFLIDKKECYPAEQLTRFIQDEETRTMIENAIYYSLEQISYKVYSSLSID